MNPIYRGKFKGKYWTDVNRNVCVHLRMLISGEAIIYHLQKKPGAYLFNSKSKHKRMHPGKKSMCDH